MKKNKNNVDYKKLTVEIPMTTFLEMDIYCTSDFFPNKKDIYYCDFIKRAIEFYIDNHQEHLTEEKICKISAEKIREIF